MPGEQPADQAEMVRAQLKFDWECFKAPMERMFIQFNQFIMGRGKNICPYLIGLIDPKQTS